MRPSMKWAAGGGGVALAALLAVSLPGQGIFAADHLDPPQRTDPSVAETPDRAADIADIFAWKNTDNDSVVLVMTFAGPQGTDAAGTYDPDVLYTLNISNIEPRETPEYRINIRFGQAVSGDDVIDGEYGVQVSGLPSSGIGVTTISGSVETPLSDDGITVQAGVFDDPFFFDLQGFKDTLAMGDLAFTGEDFFAGMNDTAVVIEIPLERLEGPAPLDIWGVTSRIKEMAEL